MLDGELERLELVGIGAGQRHVPAEGDGLARRHVARLAANVGAASARSLVSSVVTSEPIGVEELKRLADEAEQIRAYSAELERKSRQVEATAAELAQANLNVRPIVTISSILHDSIYEVRVADNGPGIPESERERIFAKFARGSMPGQIGTGLGLTISRQIVERLGGELSLAPGNAQGAEFVVRFMLSTAAGNE